MKILQVSNKIPYPEKDGGALGIAVFSRSLLKAGCEVNMLAMNTSKHSIDLKSIPQHFKDNIKLEIVEVDNRVKPFRAFMALLARKSYNISRFESKQFGEKLTGILQHERFDVIQLESIYVASYIDIIRKFSNTPVILRAHNVEWIIWQRLAEEEKQPLKKWYLAKLAKQLKKYETSIINLCDGVTTTTVNDMSILNHNGCKKPIAVIPFGVDIEKYPVQDRDMGNSLFYIGALDWLPNIQGLDWFLNHIWQNIHQKHPGAEFHIAGRNMPEWLSTKEYPGVIFHGEVENALSFIQQYGIMIVPLLAGSGVRVKIIEGMIMGKPIVTTSIGMEGIECLPGKDILVADTALEFAEAVNKFIADIELRKQLAQNGRTFALEHHDINKITEKLVEFYKEIIQLKNHNN